MCANNRLTRSNVTLGQILRNKGWGELVHVSPCFLNSYKCDDALAVLLAVNDAIKDMNEIQTSTLTLHYHLSLQGIIMDNLAWPFSDMGNGAEGSCGDATQTEKPSMSTPSWRPPG